MKRIVVALLAILMAFPALAQVPGGSEIRIGNTPVIGGTTGQCLYKNGNVVGAQACGAGTAADITVGTTTVTGGSNGNLLGKAAGVLSVFTTSGSGTVVALTAGPTFTTPILGAASATSMLIGTGATLNGYTAGSILGSFQHENYAAAAFVGFQRANTSVGSPSALLDGNPIMQLQSFGRGATGYSGGRALFQSTAAENWSDTAQGTYFSFNTTPLTTTSSTERFRVDGLGVAVGLSTAVPAGGTAGFGYRITSTANLGIFVGSGVPTLAAAQGSLYVRTDGSSIATRLYVNTDGGTTWTNFVSAL